MGYVPLPVGAIGPLLLDGVPYMVPLATTEGALVASTNRGCNAITTSGGAKTIVTNDAMTRAPLLRAPSLQAAADLVSWLAVPANHNAVATAFNGTTRFGRLIDVQATVAGRNVFLRFNCKTGDAMGMNMITKVRALARRGARRLAASVTALAWRYVQGVTASLDVVCAAFPDFRVRACVCVCGGGGLNRRLCAGAVPEREPLH